jgi:very-short-patch-repair endonuclease
MAEGIVRGQRVTEAKRELARSLRRAMTPAERTLWTELRGAGLAGLRFRRQQIIDGFVVDFYCHRAALVIEVDGGVHASQTEYDTERDRVMAAHGLHVLRVSNDSISSDLPGVLKQIEAAAREGPLPQPLP